MARIGRHLAAVFLATPNPPHWAINVDIAGISTSSVPTDDTAMFSDPQHVWFAFSLWKLQWHHGLSTLWPPLCLESAPFASRQKRRRTFLTPRSQALACMSWQHAWTVSSLASAAILTTSCGRKLHVRSAKVDSRPTPSSDTPTIHRGRVTMKCPCSAHSRRIRTLCGHVSFFLLLRSQHGEHANVAGFQCSAGCGSGQIHDGGVEQPIVKCSSCGGRTCFQHKGPWHAGLTCDDWDLVQSEPDHGVVEHRIQTLRDIKASEETIKNISKLCPGCGRSIEKNGGW